MHVHFFLFILSVVSLHAADVAPGGWLQAPLVQVLGDGSPKEVKDEGAVTPTGFPAFQKLVVRKESQDDTWIVSATVCSTNAVAPKEGSPIYARYPGGLFILVALSNLKGDVLFSVSRMTGADGLSNSPTHLYVGLCATPIPMLKGALLRQYSFRPRE
jgi:hypothetical protein